MAYSASGARIAITGSCKCRAVDISLSGVTMRLRGGVDEHDEIAEAFDGALLSARAGGAHETTLQYLRSEVRPPRRQNCDRSLRACTAAARHGTVLVALDEFHAAQHPVTPPWPTTCALLLRSQNVSLSR